MHQSSYEKMKKFVDNYLDGDKTYKILDIGSQDVNGSYKPLFENPLWEYHGLDMEAGKNVDIVLSDIYHWKEIKSNSYDIVISGQAFEHIEFIWVSMLEVTRILKTDGICCIIAPSGGYEHSWPIDCWRIYPDGFKALAKYASLKTLEVYTQWEPLNYQNDDSDVWQDSVLIAQKPQFSISKKISLFIRNKMSKFLVKDFK